MLGRNRRHQIIVVLVVGVPRNGGQVAFAQVNIIEVAGLIELEGNIRRLDHLEGNRLKAGAFGVPVERVLGEDLLVALDVGSHGVWTVVPHILIVHRLGRVDAAQLLNHRLGHWVQRLIGGQRVKVRLLGQAGVDDGVLVRRFDADRFSELGAFICSQGIGFLFGEGFRVLIIFFSALDHLQRHRSIGRIILVEIEHPLQAGSKILRYHFSLFVSVHVNPFDTFTDFKGPGLALVLCSPLLSNRRGQCTVGGRLQQAVHQLGQVFAVL